MDSVDVALVMEDLLQAANAATASLSFPAPAAELGRVLNDAVSATLHSHNVLPATAADDVFGRLSSAIAEARAVIAAASQSNTTLDVQMLTHVRNSVDSLADDLGQWFMNTGRGEKV